MSDESYWNAYWHERFESESAVRIAALEAGLALVAKALEHATWMNRWQFDEHRTGGAGELKDEAYCRCDWCKTYRDTRYDDLAPLNPKASVPSTGGEE